MINAFNESGTPFKDEEEDLIHLTSKYLMTNDATHMVYKDLCQCGGDC